jgi:DHA1 family multidrug resistance protein-like MFS transporter
LAAATRWLPESLPVHAPRFGGAELDWRTLVRGLGPLLGLALVAQFTLAMFEATFALHAQAALDYGPAEMGVVFVVCGLVMAVFQIGANRLLAGRVGAMGQIGMGLALMGISLAVLMVPTRMLSVLAVVGLLALGMALIAPNLSALISTRGGSRAGTALGAQNAANSLGQASGPIVGGALFFFLLRITRGGDPSRRPRSRRVGGPAQVQNGGSSYAGGAGVAGKVGTGMSSSFSSPVSASSQASEQ